MKLFSTALITAALMFPQIGAAEQIIGKDPQTIAQFFDTEGMEYTLTTDDVGDPKIKVDYFGTSVPIYFYGCRENVRCTEIQLFSGYKTEGSVRMSKINEWNANNRFARAYISEAGSARIEHDIYLGSNGVSGDDFAGVMGLWVTKVQEFEEFIDW